MSSPGDAPEEKKTFRGSSPNIAREAASRWLRDFSAHGPLNIRSIRVSEANDAFVATVIYSEATIELTPRHFPDYVPASQTAA